MRFFIALVATLILLPTAGAGALPQPLPPRDCNFMTVKGKRYNIKADQLRCRKARTIARSVLTGGARSGFTCQSNPSPQTRYYCRKGNAYIFVNKR